MSIEELLHPITEESGEMSEKQQMAAEKARLKERVADLILSYGNYESELRSMGISPDKNDPVRTDPEELTPLWRSEIEGAKTVKELQKIDETIRQYSVKFRELIDRTNIPE